MKIGLLLPNATFDLPGTGEVGGIEVYALELGEQLQKRGHGVTLFGGRETTHNKLNADLGLPDDPATKVLFEFVDKSLKTK